MYLNEQNTVFIDNDIKASARKIIKNVDQYEYSEKITKEFNSRFSSDISKIKLKNYFVELLKSKSLKVDGYWYLDNLGYRLCGHGNLNSFQFLFNEKYFLIGLQELTQLDQNLLKKMIFTQTSLKINQLYF